MFLVNKGVIVPKVPDTPGVYMFKYSNILLTIKPSFVYSSSETCITKAYFRYCNSETSSL